MIDWLGNLFVCMLNVWCTKNIPKICIPVLREEEGEEGEKEE
jgi:hypothetical protein